MAETKVVETPNYDAMSYDELSKISRDDHQEDTRQYDKQQNALCLVMIGGICLVCAVLFFILSFQRKYNKMAGINFASLQFVVCMACLGAAAILLTIGLIRFFKAHKIRKHLHEEIMAVSTIKNRMMAEQE